MIIPINAQGQSYDAVIDSGILAEAEKYLDLSRKVFILTDSGVPSEYSALIAKKCGKAHIKTISRGEKSKCFEVLRSVLSDMLSFGLGRGDCVVAVGGGVVGDLAGFAAAIYMRGVDFYNIPTTLLAQVDASVGGKTGIDLDGVKNIVGAFHQPKKVLIDTDTQKTLGARYIAEGMAESIKMALTSDAELFEKLEAQSISLEEIIERSLRIKSAVVEADPTETGVRKILNFGHTIGHAIEADNLGNLLHGECVALGMLPMCEPEIRSRVRKVLKSYGLPTEYNYSADKLMPYISHDKKVKADGVDAVIVTAPGSCEIRRMTLRDIEKRLEMNI